MMKKIALGDLCNPSIGQVKELPDTVIDYIDISSVDNLSKTIPPLAFPKPHAYNHA